jgi:3-oxoacyl-[acyl-carrier protein] reductase
MDLKLTGRRVLVTGSSSGIGEAIVRRLAEEGALVVVHGRNRERAEAIAAEIGAAGTAIGDLSTDDAAATVHDEAVRALGGPIEILINNAGGNSRGNTTKTPIEIAIEDWIANYHGNMLAHVRLCQLAVPDMIAARFGRVINVSSAVAVQPNNLGSDYSAAKSALNNFTVSLAGSLKNTGITVNTVSPGIIAVDGLLRFGRAKYGMPDATIEELTVKFAADGAFDVPPAGRLGTPDDLALIICTLASPLSGFVTGANYRVDGGQVRSLN